MQPTYLPWVGYFDLIDQVDVFIFLDNVQFARRSWQQRNQIRCPGGLEWLSVPVMKSGRRDQLIDAIEIQTGAFPNEHLATVARHYHKAAHFAELWPELSLLIAAAGEHRNLNRLNQAVIRWLCSALGIERRIEVAALLPVGGVRSERLCALCKAVSADTYLTPPGSVEYLREDQRVFAAAGISVAVQSYEHPVWTQLYEPFIPFASAIDLLFNEGPGSLAILRSGRHATVPLAEWPVTTRPRTAFAAASPSPDAAAVLNGTSKVDQPSQDSYAVRPLSPLDLPLVLQWRNHWDVRRFMFTQHEISPQEHVDWFENAGQHTHRHLLIFEKNGTPMGYVSFRVSASSKNAHWGFYCAPEAPKGTGRLLAQTAIQYAFSQLGIWKICGEVFSYNEPSIRLHQLLGFKKEDPLRELRFSGPTYHDVVCFGLFADDWRSGELNREAGNA
jgi:UDP-4-amino-4,6-dideoxy-N-acetyl-beta-L-altrosamine N-acetyltransferase